MGADDGSLFLFMRQAQNPEYEPSDPTAILNDDFKVRGIDKLRVVDISSWPSGPG
jgi:hypothetical protein